MPYTLASYAGSRSIPSPYNHFIDDPALGRINSLVYEHPVCICLPIIVINFHQMCIGLVVCITIWIHNWTFSGEIAKFYQHNYLNLNECDENCIWLLPGHIVYELVTCFLT